MFDRLRNGWNLAREAFGVLRADKKLLVFPVLSLLALILVCLSFILPFFLSPQLAAALQNEGVKKPVFWVLAFLFYFLTYFVIIFFNSALVACALIRFNGGEPTLGDGLSAACSRLPQILAWALVTGTVGLVLKVIENAHEKAGRFIAALLGLAWSALTFFVVPVLVVEKLGPIAAVKRSFGLVRKAWGESMSANFSIGLIMFLLFLVAGVPALLGVLTHNMQAMWAGFAVSGILWLVLALVSTAVNVIVTAILYQYASERQIPAQFDRAVLQGAFVHK